MIVDSSAVIAILRAEPDRMDYINAIAKAGRRFMAAPTLLETSMVIVGRSGLEALPHLDLLLTETGMSIVPFTAEHAAVARDAFLRYGKGRHPAGLNFGDCVAYAVAKLEDMPLLFKGEDFAKTDVKPALRL